MEAACRAHGTITLFLDGKKAGEVRFSPTPLSHLLDWAESLGFAFFFWVILKTWILQSFFIPSGSMMPNLLRNDKLFGTKYNFLLSEPEPGQMVIFSPPPSVGASEGDLWVKRVVAGPGDAIEIREGGVWLNGMAATELYTTQRTRPVFGPRCSGRTHWEIPEEGEEGSGWFLLGDNRANSLDSRCWGPLPPERLRGRPLFIYWPPGRVGGVPQRTGEIR